LGSGPGSRRDHDPGRDPPPDERLTASAAPIDG
jgi:hypothetical protein